MNKAISAGALALVWLSQAALAKGPSSDAHLCSQSVVARVGAHFRLEAFAYPKRDMYPSAENGGLIVAGVCRVWATNRSRTIAAFAYDGGGQYEKQLLLAVVDTPNDRIIASFKGVIQEDAASEVHEHSLALDMAPYALAKETRAFALRKNTFRDRCTFEGGFGGELTLFVIDGAAIRPVLEDLPMSYWRYGPVNRCGGEDVPPTEAVLFISVEPTFSNGLADLTLTAKRSDNKKPLSVKISYKGAGYDLRSWYSAFYQWWE